MDYMYYVLGFAFSEDLSKVVLIKKARPAWQAGKLNGVGGKVEKDETLQDAMTREFREEAGVEIKSWKKLGVMSGDNWEVWVFASYHNNLKKVLSQTDEMVGVYHVPSIIAGNYETISNLPWLLTVALDQDTINGKIKSFNVNY